MKRIVAICLSLLLCVFLSGCSPIYNLIDVFYGNDVVKKSEATPHIAFSNGTLFKDSEEVFFPASDFSEVTSEYAQYRSDLYFNTLSPEEQNVYIALEYAMENSYSNILVDCALVQDVDTLTKVLEFLALDSPLLEQNLRYTVGDFTTSYPVNILGIYDSYAEFRGYYISVKNFDSEFWSKKLSALEEARKIVSALPEGLSDFEKAEELYVTLAQSVTYYDYTNSVSENDVFPYLYDALITDKTHCDGHANALSLLFRLAGIEAAEKTYSSEEGDKTGHTWVTFNIDGLWYNADSTSGDLIPKKESSMHGGFYFAFSDDMRLYTEDYDEVTPFCKESKYMEPDGIVLYLSDDSFSRSVVYAFEKREPDWALIIVYSDNSYLLEKQLQKCANTLYSTVYWQSVELANGSTAVIVHGKGLF